MHTVLLVHTVLLYCVLFVMVLKQRFEILFLVRDVALKSDRVVEVYTVILFRTCCYYREGVNFDADEDDHKVVWRTISRPHSPPRRNARTSPQLRNQDSHCGFINWNSIHNDVQGFPGVFLPPPVQTLGI